MSQSQLVDRILNNKPEPDKAILNKAYIFGTKMHGRQLRASGDPYFSHPIEVAGILSDLKLDTTSVVCALLHDTIEDTNATIEDIEENFGKEVAKLVDGVTKLTLLEGKPGSTKQAENFRKLLLASASDIRILLIKLADRLHNMRTLHFIKDQKKRKRISIETLEIYAPLAGRIGMQELKEELEDLSFTFIEPKIRDILIERLKSSKKKKSKIVQFTKKELEKVLKKNNIQDRSDWNIVTIDSKASKDLDDALGIKHINENETVVSIYISNIVFWMDVLDLWESFTNRIATIYLPDRKRPMMPTKLSDDICSLLEKQKRFAFTLDIKINRNTGEIISYSYCNSLIVVKENLRHKTEELKNNIIYNELIVISSKMNRKKIYLDSVVNSHEVVSYFMVLMNYLTAVRMKEHAVGIYRFTQSNKEYEAPNNAPKDIKKFLKIWHSMGGQYCKFENSTPNNDA